MYLCWRTKIWFDKKSFVLFLPLLFCIFITNEIADFLFLDDHSKPLAVTILRATSEEIWRIFFAFIILKNTKMSERFLTLAFTFALAETANTLAKYDDFLFEDSLFLIIYYIFLVFSQYYSTLFIHYIFGNAYLLFNYNKYISLLFGLFLAIMLHSSFNYLIEIL